MKEEPIDYKKLSLMRNQMPFHIITELVIKLLNYA